VETELAQGSSTESVHTRICDRFTGQFSNRFLLSTKSSRALSMEKSRTRGSRLPDSLIPISDSNPLRLPGVLNCTAFPSAQDDTCASPCRTNGPRLFFVNKRDQEARCRDALPDHRRRAMRRWLTIPALALAMTVWGPSSAVTQVAPPPQPKPDAKYLAAAAMPSGYVGSETCALCHADVSKKFGSSPHSELALAHGLHGRRGFWRRKPDDDWPCPIRSF